MPKRTIPANARPGFRKSVTVNAEDKYTIEEKDLPENLPSTWQHQGKTLSIEWWSNFGLKDEHGNWVDDLPQGEENYVEVDNADLGDGKLVWFDPTSERVRQYVITPAGAKTRGRLVNGDPPTGKSN